MRRLFIILAMVFPAVVFADSMFLTLENDCLLKHQDNDYSHGTELKYITDGGWQFKAQQNMYTPSDLRREDHIVGDRPYCGLLLGEVGRELFRDARSPWTHYAEVEFGMVGPSAMAKETQTLIHKWLDCKKPMGWKNQLHDEFVVNAEWWTKYNWFLCDYVAAVPRAGVGAGTLQDFAELGCDLKIGWNMRKDVGNSIMFSAPRERSWLDELSVYAFCGVSQRYWLYNHVLEGSFLNDKDDDLKVDIHRVVSEIRFGVVLQYDRFYVTWYGCIRTNEFKGQKNSPDYGGLSIGWTF